MSLRHAILGVLSVQPMTGYELSDYFTATARLVYWPAGQAQIYPELRRMEAAALVVAKVARRGKVAEKRIYAITKMGSQELLRWANEPISYTAERDPAHLKVNYFDIVSLETSKKFFETHLAIYKARLQQWQDWEKKMRDRSETFLARRLAMRPAEDHDAIVEFRAIALDGQIARAKSEVAWARQGLKLIAELAASRAKRVVRKSTSRTRTAARSAKRSPRA
jgi:PadR family transcriptional regulator AphA